MTRPSSSSDRKLIDAGKALALKHGLVGLSVRETCREAGVNLGMFHYHFKTKKEFEHRILKELYGEFLSTFKLELESTANPRQRLKNLICVIGRFLRDNRRSVALIVKDLLSGREETLTFLKENFTAHMSLLVQTLKECQSKGILRNDIPLYNSLPALVLPVVVPCAVVGAVEVNEYVGLLPLAVKAIKPLIISDKAIAERAELGLRALAPVEKI
jgi:AcrR family transcriptional regulator